MRRLSLVVCVLGVMVLTAPVRARADDDLDAALASIEGPAPPEAPEVVSRDGDGRVTLRAVRVHTPPQIDGRLEESHYRSVPAVNGFIQQEPHEGQPATESTDVWIFFDDENLYVAARCWDSHPENIVANELRRDARGIFNNDNFAVILDTFYDRRNGFLFHTNPLGALYDAQVTDEGNTNSDWNTVWNVQTARFADGWTVEMAIPFKSLRYKSGQSQIWGINFRRIVRSKNEFSYLTPIAAAFRQGGLTKLSQAATIVGVETPASSLNFEVKPYATAGVLTNLDAEVPYENDFDPDAGFDVKYGVTKSVVADFTVNTDFAQVEADDEQVNLTRFSLFFPEKREFFLEGQGIFGFGGGGGRGFGGPDDVPILFFSRRIGLDDETLVPIRAGGRMTGRSGRYTLGLLNIQTGGVDAAGLEPTNFSVVRVKRDVLRRSTIGVIATHRNRSVEHLGSNSVLGLDASFTFYENLNIDAYYAKSATEDVTGQEESYYGRVSYGGDRYGFNFSHLNIGESFNPDIGFVRRPDIRKTSGRLRFSPRPSSIPAVRKFNYEASYNYYENSAGQVETRELELQFETQFSNGDEFRVSYEKNFEFLIEPFDITEDVIIPVGGYDFDRVRVNYSMGPQRRVSGWVNGSTGSFYNGKRTEVGFFGRVEVTPKFSVEPDIERNWVDLPEGSFVTNLLRLRSTLALSARSFIGALVQYSTSSERFSTNIRYRWEYRPGSDIYVVYTDGRDINGIGFPDLRDRSLVFKITRLVRF